MGHPSHELIVFTRSGAVPRRDRNGRQRARGVVTPHAMVVDSEGHLYVVDSGNHRVQKFAIET